MTLYEKTLAAIETAVETEGDFTALVSTWGPEPDRQGDVVARGAFTASLARWRASGLKIPVVWSHQVSDPNLVIGSADPAKTHETDAGLVVVGRLNVYTSTVASHVRDLLKNGDVSGWSFSFSIDDARPRRGGGKHLLALDIGEIGPTIFPANRDTRTIAIKGESPDRREPERLSHVQLENLLRREGILARMVPPFEEDEIAEVHAGYARRRNGRDDHKAQMMALLAEGASSTKTASAIRIATFPTT